MLTGRRAFEAEDVPLTMSRVLQREPDWDTLPAGVPAYLASIIRQCLAKDPRNRVRDMGDIRLMLDGALGFPVAQAPERTGRSSIALWQRPASVAASVLGAVAVTAFTTWSVTRPAPVQPAAVTRTSVLVPQTHAITNFGSRVIAISPAGTHVAYVANEQLYVRALDALEARALEGTERTRPSDPFFSPDGRWIAFNSSRDGALQKVALEGGAVVSLAQAKINGASWGEDGTIVYAQAGQGILRVPAAGGKPKLLVAVKAAVRVQQPQVLPGGQAVLYTRCSSGGCSTPDAWDAAEVVVEDLATGERTVVVENGADARYLASGHLIYALGNTILAVAVRSRAASRYRHCGAARGGREPGGYRRRGPGRRVTNRDPGLLVG